MFGIQRVTIDYLEHPVGILGSPQFAWSMESDRKNVTQSAYRLQIAKDGDFSRPVYDSEKRETEQSAQIQAEGFVMEPLTGYQIRVKAWDNQGEESPWSSPAEFVSALQAPGQWKGSFIGVETAADEKVSKGTYIRGTFRVEKPVQNAYMVSTALGLYHPFLNGEPVGDDEMAPGWTSYGNRILYQTHEVTDLLVRGENVLGAHLGAGWYKGTIGLAKGKNNYGTETAFLAQILIRYQDGTEETIVTDESFKGCDSPVLFSEIYDGEIYDARKEQPGWNKPGFDDDSWLPVHTVQQSKDVLVPQGGCKVRELIPLPVKEIIITPQGDTVLDFGQNLTGWVHVKVDGKEGQEMILNHFEVLDARGNVYTENLRTAKETLTYICDGKGEAIYRPSFTFQGFRYIRVAAYPGEVKKENFTAWAVHSDMRDTGHFFCSNPLLNQLQHNISWGLKGNFLDIPTDCPQRDERLGWTGDAQIFCRTATFLKDTYTFFSKWLKDVAADQAPNGAVPHVVPDILTNRSDDDWLVGEENSMGATAWGDVAVIAPWTLYLSYGDRRIIEEQYDSMKGWIDFMNDHAEDYVWKFARQFGDWVALDAEEGSYFGATPEDMICTAYFAYSTGLFVKMARAVGRTEDAKKYQALYDAVADSYRRHFIKDGHMTARTQTAQIITLYFGLAKEEDRPSIMRDLLELLAEHDGHLVTGFVGTPYFCHALSQNGHTKEAYELLLKEDFPSWLYQVKMGATTVWEHWDGLKPDGTMWSADMNSFNHYAYGAIGEWLYRVVAGIEADENAPGYKHTVFQPQTGGGLTEVKGSYDSVYGTVGCSWRAEADRIVLKVQVPVNTTATIVLEKGALPEEGDVKFTCRDGIYQASVGSGTYTAAYRRTGVLL